MILPLLRVVRVLILIVMVFYNRGGNVGGSRSGGRVGGGSNGSSDGGFGSEWFRINALV